MVARPNTAAFPEAVPKEEVWKVVSVEFIDLVPVPAPSGLDTPTSPLVVRIDKFAFPELPKEFFPITEKSTPNTSAQSTNAPAAKTWRNRACVNRRNFA